MSMNDVKELFWDLMKDYTEITNLSINPKVTTITKIRYWIGFIEIHDTDKLFKDKINNPIYGEIVFREEK